MRGLIELELVNLLKEKDQSIAGAESCTGGLASKIIVDVPGSSSVFFGSVVAYSDDAKVRILGVRPSTIAKKGAVSEEVVREMANGAMKKFGASIAFSISGIAGPGGGTAEKPVGTVCFGFDFSGRIESFTRHFHGNRDLVRRVAAITALDYIRSYLKAG
jgi:PncC family amidohydrolase